MTFAVLGSLHRLRAEASLAVGRHADALDAVRRARRQPGSEPFLLALEEADALFGLLRYGEALALVTRALGRRPPDPDLEARLRVVRGHALWLTGRVKRGEAEVRKAAGQATTGLTRARARETLGLMAWKEQDLARAREHLAVARGLHAEGGSRSGFVRALETEGAVLRDAGRLAEALRIQTRRVEIASTTTRLDAIARARNDRGSLLTVMGRWKEAREDLDLAADLFRRVSDPRELTLAAVNRAAVDVAAGDLPAARAAVERAREILRAAPGDLRSLAEALLVLSDVQLAAGEAWDAERSAAEASRLFDLVVDRVGECRSRFRRSHALIALGRVAEAAREARRSLRVPWPARTDLKGLGELALGRALLRGRGRAAHAAFERALAFSEERPGIAHAARLGRALARGAGGDDPEVRASLAALEAWGDKRLLAHCVGDVRELLGEASAPPSPPPIDSARPRALAEEEPAPRFPEIVGRCPSMEALYRQMAFLAASEVSVHVFGETGTGKEKVARSLHRHSPRSRGPFVAINASTLSDELFEAEMFGHTRGAFTGAVSERRGHVAEAEGGTLFIDEVTDLTARGQAKLLRLLQEKEYRRLGENETRRADVRIVTASNVELERRVVAGLFREDLMYRLNVVVLTLPPLRERGEDLRRLARHFLRLAAEREGIPAPTLTAEVAEALARYPWPGNIRELENEMSRLVVFAGRGPLEAGQLSPRLVGERRPALSSLREAQLTFEREHIARSLASHAGNRARTAVALGITRQALVAKIRRLAIS